MSPLIEKVLKVIDWIAFLTLAIIALVSVEGSYEAYSNGSTTWSTEQRPIPSHPTFVLCLQLSEKSYMVYGLEPVQDFNITILPNSKR